MIFYCSPREFERFKSYEGSERLENMKTEIKAKVIHRFVQNMTKYIGIF